MCSVGIKRPLHVAVRQVQAVSHVGLNQDFVFIKGATLGWARDVRLLRSGSKPGNALIVREIAKVFRYICLVSQEGRKARNGSFDALQSALDTLVSLGSAGGPFCLIGLRQRCMCMHVAPKEVVRLA